MTPREFIETKGLHDYPVIYKAYDGYKYDIEDLLYEYARLETEELNKLLDIQIDTFLTPEKQQELIEFIKDESNLKTKE